MSPSSSRRPPPGASLLSAGAVILSLLLRCDSPVERNIALLAEGGEDAEEAKMELNLARGTAILPLITAFQTQSYAPRVRVDLAEALFRLYIRETDPRIFVALTDGLADPDASLRAFVARGLGDLRRRESAGPLIDLLLEEQDQEVRLQILLALKNLGLDEEWHGTAVRTDKMTAEQHARFTGILVDLAGQVLPEPLRRKTLEWLEILAEEKALEAQKLILQADLAGGEALLLEARDLVPDSKNINHKLGRYYYDNGAPEKGLEILSGEGLVMHVEPMTHRPRIDGVLEEPAWQVVEPLTQFYQCLFNMRAYPIEGRAEVYVGYVGSDVYLGVKGYEPSTEQLVANHTERDSDDIAQDDCVEIFLDTNHDYRTYYHIILNSLGAFKDAYASAGDHRDKSWNADFQVATAVEDTFWTLEVSIPADQLESGTPLRGNVWGFNVARVRIGNGSEFGQWAPTYGAAHRPGRFGFLFFE